MKAIVLGSDRGIRHLDSAKSCPVALLEDRCGKRLLDWILSALSQVGINNVIFVGGYHIEKVVRFYPKLRFYYNPDWQNGGDLQALGYVSSELDGPCVVIRSDIVFRPNVVCNLLEADADVVIGTQTYVPAADNSLSERFAGLTALSATAAARLRRQVEIWSQDKTSEKTPELMQVLLDLGLPTLFLNVGENWMRVETPRSLSHFVFGTKGQTLERLQPLVTQATILDQARFTVREWRDSCEEILDRIQAVFPNGRLIIRSSALNEDSWTESQAGRFHSELGTDARDRQAICDAIESVIGSFAEKDSEHDLNEVFVQPYLDSVSMSGVLFTRHPETGAPYILVNYDDTSQRTDTVTSGRGDGLRTTIIYKHSDPSVISKRDMAHLMDVISELEELSGHDSLDIEFAFDADGRCYILQVRVVVENRQDFELTDVDFGEELTVLREYVDELMKPRPHLHGATTILANMPDWNPAELIGFSPRPLALSVFQHLITNRIWGKARTAIGYQETSPEPLVISLVGHPYVDTRASLNSFLPSSLSHELGEKLVTHYLTWLREHPEFHDKLEFEVALTCLDFDFERHRLRLLENGFLAEEIEEIRRALLSLTDNIVGGRVATIENQIALVDQLAERRAQALSAGGKSLISFMRTVDFLVDDCLRFGTLPFSIVARYAFIATSFLKSLQAQGVFSPEEIENLSRSIPTVATEISAHLRVLSTGAMTLEEFLMKYGHLRPGTFDLTTPSYAEAPEFYLGNLDGVPPVDHHERPLEEAAYLFDQKSSKIADLIRGTGFTFGVTELRDFILASIPAREKAKFEFTKNLSAALSLIAEFGERIGLSRDDMSFLPINRLLDIAINSPSNVLKQELTRVVTLNRKRYSLYKTIKLPHMLTSASDIDCFELLKWLPNYTTSKRVIAPVIDVDTVDSTTDLAGKIALIESADPGYDWIFGHGIHGLVTKYGGAASHMAIRAAELGLPAAIGCGELTYNSVLTAQVVELDCAKQCLRVLR